MKKVNCNHEFVMSFKYCHFSMTFKWLAAGPQAYNIIYSNIFIQLAFVVCSPSFERGRLILITYLPQRGESEKIKKGWKYRAGAGTFPI